MLYRQRSSFFYEIRIKPLKKISPFRKRASEPGRTQKTKYAAVSRIPSEVAVGRRVQGSVKRNVFVKPNEQSRKKFELCRGEKWTKEIQGFFRSQSSAYRLPIRAALRPTASFIHRLTKHTCIPINNGSYIQLYTPSDFRAAAPDRQSEPSPQSRVCRLAPSGRELRTSPASVVGL